MGIWVGTCATLHLQGQHFSLYLKDVIDEYLVGYRLRYSRNRSLRTESKGQGLFLVCRFMQLRSVCFARRHAVRKGPRKCDGGQEKSSIKYFLDVWASMWASSIKLVISCSISNGSNPWGATNTTLPRTSLNLLRQENPLRGQQFRVFSSNEVRGRTPRLCQSLLCASAMRPKGSIFTMSFFLYL